jgi:ribosomal protein S13
MAYIFGTNLSPNKSIHNALQDIYGIGKNQSDNICNQLCIDLFGDKFVPKIYAIKFLKLFIIL